MHWHIHSFLRSRRQLLEPPAGKSLGLYRVAALLPLVRFDKPGRLTRFRHAQNASLNAWITLKTPRTLRCRVASNVLMKCISIHQSLEHHVGVTEKRAGHSTTAIHARVCWSRPGQPFCWLHRWRAQYTP